MKGAIVYKSKYGSAREYAWHLQQALGVPMLEADEVSGSRLMEFDFLCLGSPVYNGDLLLRKWIWHNRRILETKKLFYFIVCATPAHDKDVTTAILSGNISGVLQNNNPVYFLGGRINIAGLSLGDRIVLQCKAILTKDPVRKYILLKGMNRVHPHQLEPLINAVEEYTTMAHLPVR